MTIVGAFDVHRSQLTFEDRGDVTFALEGCAGWRYVTEELRLIGVDVHLAEPADTAALRGRKRRAKTDRSDAAHLRTHLQAGDLPESWIPPEHVLEARVLVRLYKDLLDERGADPARACHLVPRGRPGPGLAQRRRQSAKARGRRALAVDTGLRQIDRLSGEMAPLQRSFERLSRHQPGARALRTTHYGIGPVTSVAIWAEMGDCRRFANSDDAVRHTGLDVTVFSSADKRTKGHLARQGPAVLRWALYESAMCASRVSSPDHAYYLALKERRNGQLAAITIARKLARRCFHTLIELGEDALSVA